ncbi:MAG: aminotransferase class III-fold pyridoxal phosphate-dependent enzyme, partial [Gemmatimonadetes bacterium]|nr:aminotransferase class III-fold pyridoxal phosphate-dependent enzyme [Gemmatimonadota bacterium]
GAVVTTPAIAASFANGMEYFNTFGGNPVSCAAGLAVLAVIAEEDLQQNALRVGERLLADLRLLQSRHSLIGDVRGRGLFLGIELVRDRETLEPAGPEAAYLVERAREQGVLLSTDGPFHNVIKIKPPLVFSATDATRLVETLDRVLAEDVLKEAGA